jgi:hypothetical protein
MGSALGEADMQAARGCRMVRVFRTYIAACRTPNSYKGHGVGFSGRRGHGWPRIMSAYETRVAGRRPGGCT